MTDKEVEASLAELSRLVTTMGARVIGQMSQRRATERGITVLGDGKLKELARWTGGTGVIGPGFVKKKHKAALKFEAADEETDTEENFEDLESEEDEESNLPAPKELAKAIIFDCDLSPSQLRNVESATGVKVYDRTGVIIEIFSRHARTKAAKLQVEIARLAYLAPRIRETGAKEDRQEGGGGKGSGETSIELDRRNIRDRIKELKEELAELAEEQNNRRVRRGQEISVALVGYTNAGKSSLMRALTGSDVMVADKLFATLDTTVRLLHPETIPKILISDTVGFIKKLPHDLVASFKSTLDEALSASLLLYVVDSSDATFRSQLEVTRTVLGEVGASDIPSFLVLNKVDRLSELELSALKAEYPQAVFLSAKDPKDVAALRLRLIETFETEMIEETLFVPYTAQGAIGEIRSRMRVLQESFDENGTTFKVRAYAEELGRFKSRYQKPTE
ncbi:MAG: GTPase HflX [Bdellovibrionaceae bacterium]|nr:GTPase HflX [Pseudobdellovibrionaceae bacterium]